MHEDTASYEIFKKQSDNTTVLVETVKGIEEARKRLHDLDQQADVEYFVFDPIRAEVIEPNNPDVAIDPFAP